MARSTVYNNITSEESLAKILQENQDLSKDFLDYLKSIDRSPSTVVQYKNDLQIFFVWNLENNNNKRFPEITKREFARFQSFALGTWGWSSKRMRRVKATLSSLSNYIENILDEEEEYQGYRAVVRKIENPVDSPVREKTVFTQEELQGLLDHLVEEKKYKQACIVALGMYSGKRKSELPRFKVSYFTDDNVIFGSLYKTPEQIKTKGRGSKGKMLYAYTLKRQFDPYLHLWLEERKNRGIESEWLFPDEINPNEQLKTDTMDGWCDSFTKFLGKDFYYHSLRHRFVTQLADSNIPATVIQDICGWTDVSMVQVYNDQSKDETIGKYFDENGIKTVEQKSLSDI